jgi:hypothetical protein
MSRVFRKTALGNAILTRPNSGLTSVERALLTMIDGKRNASDLRKRLGTFGNVNVLLRELFDDRLIELHPDYVKQFSNTQDEIARENAALVGNFVTTTTATIGKGANLPTAKRDLRDALPPLDPEPLPSTIEEALQRAIAEERSTLQLDPYGEEVRTPAISAWAMDRAKMFAKQYVFGAVGASGTTLCLAIERAKDVKEFLRFTQAASKTIHDAKGAAASAEFDRRLQDILNDD